MVGSIQKVLEEGEEELLRSLNKVESKKLREAVNGVNGVLSHIQTADITETSQLIWVTAVVVTHTLRISKETTRVKMEPNWKRRIKNKIAQLRREIGKLQRKKSNQSKGEKGLTWTEKKYNVKGKGLDVVSEELKQWVTAKAAKLRRYEQRINQYRHNRIFQYDQKKLHQKLDGKPPRSDIRSDPQESCEY